MRKFLLVLIAICALYLAVLVVLSQRPGSVGLVDGALRACPEQGCVNSQMGSTDTRIAPLYNGSQGKLAWRALQWLASADPHGRIREIDGAWMAIEWRATPLPIKSDLEFLFLQGPGLIHIRSQGRLGRFGFDAHTDAVEFLRGRLPLAMGELDVP